MTPGIQDEVKDDIANTNFNSTSCSLRPGRKPILLRGARQVGKTSLVREFARRQGLPLWEVNLEKHRSLDALFKSLDVKAVIRELSLVLNTRGIGKEPGILFLDEIQEAPHALTCMRYFYEEKQDIPLIAAGSFDFCRVCSRNRRKHL